MPITALLALTLIAPQAGGGQAGTFAVNGKQIPLRLISAPPSLPSADFMGWDGWQYLSAAPTGVWQPYQVSNDWTEIAKRYDAAKGKTGQIWRTKIFVLTRTETMEKDPSGVWRMNRDQMDEAQLQETLEGIARAKALITAEYNGSVEFVPDVEIETDTIRQDDLGPDFAKWYVGPRINGGSYTAEDKVFRGPFHSVMYILPGYRDVAPTGSWVNQTPVAAVVLNGKGPLDAGGLEENIVRTWGSQLSTRMAVQGFAGVGRIKAGGMTLPLDWTVATSLEEPTADTLLQRMRDGAGLYMHESADEILRPSKSAWKAPAADAAIVDDTERGKVLKLTENPKYRSGGIGLPLTGATVGTIDATPTLTLYAKSTDRDPISIRFDGAGGSVFWVSIGRDPLLAKPTGAVVGSAPFEDNGQWQKIAVDLRPLAKEAEMSQIIGMAIEPSPNALKADMLEYGSAEYVLDDIKLCSEPAQPLLPAITPDFASTDPDARALAVAKATTSGPEVLAALKDSSPTVRLNATAAYLTLKDIQAESALASDTGDLYAPIQATALEALANLGTETGRGTMRQVLKYTIGDYAKATAARLLAASKDKKYTGDILLLFTNLSWQTKLAGVDALAALDVPSGARHGFLRNDDPAVRLETVRLTDPKNLDDRSRLQWHAVNDPADLVRAASYIKLIESGDAKDSEDGYKGVRDDSYFVRLLLLDYFKAHPAAGNRKAIDLALADRFSIVRAAALDTLAEQPGDVTDEEISSLFADKYPVVQLALAQLATKKKLKLPEATIGAMRSSPDKRVVEAARAFG